MDRLHQRAGYTLVEMLAVAAMVSFVLLTFVMFSSKIALAVRRFQIRQQIQMESRSSLDVLSQRLRNGKARSLIISTPSVVPLVPNSRVDFDLQSPLPSGATSYVIMLDQNVIYAQELGGPVGVGPRKAIAKQVGSLMFTGDSRDPAIVHVMLQFAAPWDQSNDPSHVAMQDVQQEIHMVENQ
jgi:hypothetical protein